MLILYTKQRLQELPGQDYTFTAIDELRGPATTDSAAKRALLDLADKKCPTELRLKVGAQVVLLQNQPKAGLVNGSRGVCIRFETAGVELSAAEASYGVPKGTYSNCPVIRFDNGVKMTVKPYSIWQGGGPSGSLTRLQVNRN